MLCKEDVYIALNGGGGGCRLTCSTVPSPFKPSSFVGGVGERHLACCWQLWSGINLRPPVLLCAFVLLPGTLFILVVPQEVLVGACGQGRCTVS